LADAPSTPLCSDSAGGSDPKNAFDRRRSPWYTIDSTGKELYIGADFGADARRATRRVRIQWAEPDAIAPAIRVDYSDDGRQWSSAGTYDVTEKGEGTSVSETCASTDSKFLLPPVGAHRYWRVVAIGIAAGNRFGLDELYFDVAFSNDSEADGKL
jgi:hypothetical protein